LAIVIEELIDDDISQEEKQEEKKNARPAIYAKVFWKKETTHPESRGETPERWVNISEEPIDDDLFKANLLLASHNTSWWCYLPRKRPIDDR
jgi:hypothetical protein